MAAIRILEKTKLLMLRCFRALLTTAERFYWEDRFTRAAGLAYTSLLSVVPFFAVAFGLLAAFAVSRAYVPQLQDFIFKNFIPDQALAEQVSLFLKDFSGKLTDLNGAVTAISLAFFFVTAILLINSIESSFNAIWQVHEPRPIAQKLGIFSAVILLIPVLSLAVFAVLGQNLEGYLIKLGFGILPAEVFLQLFIRALPFVLVFLIFVAMYLIVPRARVKLTSAVFGALVAGILFYLAYKGFALFVARYASYSALYGAIAAIPSFLVWLYVVWVVVLFGVEAGFQYQHGGRSGRLLSGTLHQVGDARILLALQVLLRLKQAFSCGKEMPSEELLIQELGCSHVVLRPVINALQSAGIIAVSERDSGALVLLKSPDLVDVRELSRTLFGGERKIQFGASLGAAFQHLSDQGAASLSLAELEREAGGSEGG